MKRARTSEFDETLVRLWNELEPLRLAGDQRGLEAVERTAARIAREGDEAQRYEAERLLETLGKAKADRSMEAPATARLDAEVATAGRHFEESPEVEAETPELEGEETPRGRRLAPLIWTVVFVVILIVNILGSRK